MSKENKKNKKKNKQDNRENEIIIGVTTSKEKVRVEKKSTRTKTKPTQPKTKSSSNDKKKNSNQKNTSKKQVHKSKIVDNTEIKKINRKKVIVSLIILFLIAIGGTIYYLTTPVFNVSNIEVYGYEKNSVDTYISLSRIELGSTNIFAFTNNGIKNKIKENAYVEDVKLKRKLPNTVQLYITERKVAYQIEYANSYIYLDNQGYILEIQEEKKDVSIIKGFNVTNETIKPGQRLGKDDLIKLNIVSKIINYCKYNNIENKITSLDVTDATNYILNFKEDEKIVYLGDASNLSERLSLLKTILKDEKGNKGEIFMNGDINKDKVYFREEK